METEDPALAAKNKGNGFYKKKKFDEAIACYNEAIKLDPKEMNYYGNKVAVLTVQKKYEEGHKVLQEAFEKYKTLDYKDKDFAKIAKLYARKARIFELEKNFPMAIKWCEDSLLESQDYKVKK